MSKDRVKWGKYVPATPDRAEGWITQCPVCGRAVLYHLSEPNKDGMGYRRRFTEHEDTR